MFGVVESDRAPGRANLKDRSPSSPAYAASFLSKWLFIAQVPSICRLTCQPEEYTRLVIKSLPALMPLSFKGAKEAMVQWGGTQYGEEVLDQIYLFSAGVPRLLEYVFQTDGELASTFEIAFNAMSECFKNSYSSAAPFFDQPDVALSLVLCSAVRWNATDRELVPGTSTRWSDIFNAGAAFPNGTSVLVPLVWWCPERKEQLAQKGPRVEHQPRRSPTRSCRFASVTTRPTFPRDMVGRTGLQCFGRPFSFVLPGS